MPNYLPIRPSRRDFARPRRNDEGHPAPSDDQTPIDRAFSIFVQQARSRGCSYFGDMVRGNLSNLLASGHSPDSAVRALFTRSRR